MKAAQQIAALHSNATDASEAAESAAIAKDQVWGGDGYTVYVFDDNSILAQSGPEQIAVDADDLASVQSYVEWLGADAARDQRRIDDMLAALKSTSTYRAAYIPADGDSTGGGIVLTSYEDRGLPDDELLAKAEALAAEIGAEGDIEIGDWTE